MNSEQRADINWANMPEGATHYTFHASAGRPCLRQDEGRTYFWCGEWREYGDPEQAERHMLDAVLLCDPVNHPDHYASGDIECIDAIRAALTDEEFRGYCKGNMLKHVWRERKKGGVESLKKCGWYLDRLIQEVE